MHIYKLLEIFQEPEHIFVASLKKFEQIGFLSKKDIHTIQNSRNPSLIQKNYAALERSSIKFIVQEDKEYPEKLKHIYQPPLALYMKGEMPKEDMPSIAIVGARNCTGYGKEMARHFGKVLSEAGVQIISGMARGIDSYAHLGAMEGGTGTFAVLGTGVDICYPRENYHLYEMLQKAGGLISEFPNGTKGKPGHFPLRNRIISGLCDGVLVVEAKERSGALITADFGLDQGKEIFAIPGRAGDVLSVGCNNLIRMGAELVTDPVNILQNFHIRYTRNVISVKKNNKLLDSKEKIVYACLSFMPKHLDEIFKEIDLQMTEVMELLIKLEMKGYIKQAEKNYYMIER